MSLLAEPRADLLAGVAAQRFELPGGAIVAAGGLPLLRRADGGGLEQAVRFIAPASARLALRDGDRDLGTASGARGLLYAPEPERPVELTLAVELDGAAHAWPLELRPQRRWTVHVVHHSHLDIGYTDPQPAVLANHLRYLDAALDLADAEPGFRWTVEAALPLARWLAARPRRERDALLRHVREGRIEVCALPYTMHSEAYSLGELARQLHLADALRERHGIEIVTAMQTDVPGATLGLGELLAAAGIRYLSVAHNYAGRSVPYLNGGQALERPFRWRLPSGRELLVWHADSPHGIAYMEGNLLGLADGYETARELLPEYLLALATRPYPYSPGVNWLTGLPSGVKLTRRPQAHDLLHLRVQGAFADNAAPSPVPARVARAFAAQWAWPRVLTSSNREFFEAAEERLSPPTYEGDWTDWWADGIGSAARELAVNRRAQETLRSAETLHAVADALGADGDPDWPQEAERAHDAMALFDEHTWGAANPWSDALEWLDSGALQWGWKAARAHDAGERADALLEAAGARLAGWGAPPADAHAGVVVLNPSSWPRTDVVELLLPESRVPLSRALAVVDAESGERVPCALAAEPHPDYRPRGQWLRFLARVPAGGWARYRVVADRDGVPEPAAGDPAVLETAGVRARVDARRGALASLRIGTRELVATDAAFAFNQLVYDRYATAPHANHLSSRVPAAGPWLLADRTIGRDGVVVAATSTAVEERMELRLRADGADELAVAFTLPHGLDRVEIRNVLRKGRVHDKEAVFFAFPFALADPRVRFEIAGGVQAADGPLVPGSARHMRAVRHWVALDDVVWATRDAPLVQVGELHLPYAPFPGTLARPEPATVFSWAMNNGWDTNFPPAQGGEVAFAYAVSTGAPRDTAAAVARPLVGVLTSPRATGDAAPRGSFAAVDHPDVELVALTRSRRDPARAVALLNSTAPEPVHVPLAFDALPLRPVAAGDFLERASAPLDGPRVLIRPGELLAVTLA